MILSPTRTSFIQSINTCVGQEQAHEWLTVKCDRTVSYFDLMHKASHSDALEETLHIQKHFGGFLLSSLSNEVRLDITASHHHLRFSVMSCATQNLKGKMTHSVALTTLCACLTVFCFYLYLMTSSTAGYYKTQYTILPSWAPAVCGRSWSWGRPWCELRSPLMDEWKQEKCYNAEINRNSTNIFIKKNGSHEVPEWHDETETVFAVTMRCWTGNTVPTGRPDQRSIRFCASAPSPSPSSWCNTVQQHFSSWLAWQNIKLWKCLLFPCRKVLAARLVCWRLLAKLHLSDELSE